MQGKLLKKHILQIRSTVRAVASMPAVKIARKRKAEADKNSHNTGLIRPPDIEELQAQLEAAQNAYEDIKAKYRAVIALNRQQKSQMARTRMIEQLCEISGERFVDDRGGKLALTRVLRLVMDLAGAESGVLWLREQGGNVLNVGVTTGRIANMMGLEPTVNLNALTPDAVRAHCASALLNSAPSALPVYSRLDALLGNNLGDDRAPLTEPEEDALNHFAIVAQQAEYSAKSAFGTRLLVGEPVRDPSDFDLLLMPHTVPTPAIRALNSVPATNPGLVGVTLLRTLPTSAEPMGKIVGAVGICDPRHRQRFASSELEQIASLCRALTSVVSGICECAEAQKLNREVELLQDVRRLAQAAAHSGNKMNRDKGSEEQTTAQIVELALELASSEDCTLFLLDAQGQRLEAKAVRGQQFNPLDHIRFERGLGMAGWVASCGKRLHVPDLMQETNLLPLNIEMLPPQTRSFLALPLCVENTILGVLTLSHAQPHAFTPHTLRLLTELAEYAAVLLVPATQTIRV